MFPFFFFKKKNFFFSKCHYNIYQFKTEHVCANAFQRQKRMFKKKNRINLSLLLKYQIVLKHQIAPKRTQNYRRVLSAGNRRLNYNKNYNIYIYQWSREH